MPNAYASIAEIKAGMPDGIRSATTKYDALIYRLASEISRAIDAWCNRTFFPMSEVRYFDADLGMELCIPDLLTVSQVEYSLDFGVSYSTLSAANYYTATQGNYNFPGSWDQLLTNYNGTLRLWPAGQRSVRVTGVWAYVDDRDLAWESTGDTVQNNPLTAGGTSLQVTDLDGLDLVSFGARFSPGQLLRIESEYVETTLAVDTGANTIGILRGRNATTAASHVQGMAIDVWRCPDPIRRACVIQVNRHMERGFQGFGDSRATPDTGTVSYSRQWDPEALALMSPYRQRALA